MARVYTGCKVKINPNTFHPNYPNLRIDLWTGTVDSLCNANGIYYCKIFLDNQTLSSLTPEFIEFCEKANLNYTILYMNISKCHTIK